MYLNSGFPLHDIKTGQGEKLCSNYKWISNVLLYTKDRIIDMRIVDSIFFLPACTKINTF